MGNQTILCAPVMSTLDWSPSGSHEEKIGGLSLIVASELVNVGVCLNRKINITATILVKIGSGSHQVPKIKGEIS